MADSLISQRLAASVIAVPPLARDAELAVDRVENAKLVSYLKSGGIRTLLYGGNAVFYHIRLSEYEATVRMLLEIAGEDVWVIPSLGSAFGMMLDQAAVLAKMDRIDTAMILPQRELADAEGIATGIRHVVDRLGKPIVLYLKFDRWLPAHEVAKLVEEGRVSWIKYAVVREDTRRDDYLRELLECVPKDLMVSGMGEQPAIVHMREFGMASFTSGCVCVRPQFATDLLHAVHRQDWERAERLRAAFEPLEDLRNEISPIRVLHRAVGWTGRCEAGPMMPLLGELPASALGRIETAVRNLISCEMPR